MEMKGAAIVGEGSWISFEEEDEKEKWVKRNGMKGKKGGGMLVAGRGAIKVKEGRRKRGPIGKEGGTRRTKILWLF